MPGPVTTIAGGTAMGAPNVCLVPAPPAPPIPTPFGSEAMIPTALQTTVKVMVQNMPALIEGSQTPMTMPMDAAGAQGGVMSGTFSQKCEPKLFTQKVKFEGKGVVTIGAMCQMNNGNAVGNVAAPSQAAVLALG